MEQRVVITGVGVISPVGNNITDFWQSLAEGKCGIDHIKGFEEYELQILNAYLTRILHNLAPMAQVDPGALDPFLFFSLMQREETERKERNDA